MNMELFELESKLLYSMIVAGKSANFADKAIAEFLKNLSWGKPFTETPFEMLRKCDHHIIGLHLLASKTGNYTKLEKAIKGLLEAKFDLNTVKPEQLETIHGIGPKTSRFFIIWSRPHEQYAALDVHVLRWLAALGHKVPRNTPQDTKVYLKLEKIFLEEAAKLGKTARELDKEIWEAGAGRTQETATPELKL